MWRRPRSSRTAVTGRWSSPACWRGTEHPEAAREVIDFLLSPAFQRDVPLRMFVYPVVEGTPLPEPFERFGVAVETRCRCSPAQDVARASSGGWVETWTDLMLALRGPSRRRLALAAVPRAVPRSVLRLPARLDRRVGAGRRRDRRRCSGTTDCASVVWFTSLAGRGVDRADAGGGAAGGLPGGALPVPGTIGAAGRRAGGVRAADRRRRGTAFAGPRPSLGALFAAHVFFNLAVVVGVVGGLLVPARPGLRGHGGRDGGDAGSGGSPTCCGRSSRPSIVGAAALVFLFTFTSFGVVLLLGGPGGPRSRWRSTGRHPAAEPAGRRGADARCSS